MNSMVAKDHSLHTGSPKVEVGEIDTRSPFASVKHAVSLFGEVASSSSGEKPVIFRKSKPHSAESVYAKDTQLHLAKKELNKLREQLKNAEITKTQAHQELQVAKRTLDDLTRKLNTLSKAKESAIKATEAAREQAKHLEEATNGGTLAGKNGGWKQDLQTSRELYRAAASELDAAKQDLSKVRHEFDAAVGEKNFAIKQVAQAEESAKANMERTGEMSEEIRAVRESLQQVKLATMEAQQEHVAIHADRDIQRVSYMGKLDDSADKLLALKNENDPELVRNLENQIIETETEIGAVSKQMDDVKASDIDTVRSVTSELDEAKESLHKAAEDESALRKLVESLKVELERVKKEHSELKEKESETESIAGNYHVKLRKCKSELEAVTEKESRVAENSEDMMMTLRQVSSESENARREAEEVRKQAEERRKEVAVTISVLEDTEQRLMAALDEATEAKAAEARAVKEVKLLSEKADTERHDLRPERVMISKEELESLSRKVEESDKLAKIKVAAVMAQVEAVRASESEWLRRLEAAEKEVEDMRGATKEAVKKAETAEAAKKAVEGELRRWRERELKKTAETAAWILAETDTERGAVQRRMQRAETIPAAGVEKQNSVDDGKKTKEKGGVEVRRLEKARTSLSKRSLWPSLSIFRRRTQTQVERGSPSYLPGENFHPV